VIAAAAADGLSLAQGPCSTWPARLRFDIDLRVLFASMRPHCIDVRHMATTRKHVLIEEKRGRAVKRRDQRGGTPYILRSRCRSSARTGV